MKKVNLLNHVRVEDLESRGWRLLFWDQRMNAVLPYLKDKPFSRRLYREYFPAMSTATASRDLQRAVVAGILKKLGDKRQAVYVSSCGARGNKA